MVKYHTLKVINEQDWSNYISEIYNRTYKLQQQEGCYDKGTLLHITVPCEITGEEHMNDDIPEIVNSPIRGVKLTTWLNRDPNLNVFIHQWENRLFWQRNFYPNLETIINDLHSKGLLEEGNYVIDMDW